MKKVLNILLAVFVLLNIAVTAFADSSSSYGIRVGDIALSADNCLNDDGNAFDKKLIYDDSSRTLYLNGYVNTNADDVIRTSSGSSGELKIILSGTNVIPGIHASCPIVIMSSSKGILKSSYSYTGNQIDYYGMIDSDSYITVKNASVTCDTIKAASCIYFENATINTIQIESSSDISSFTSSVLVANMLAPSGELYFSESTLTGQSQVYPDFVTSRGTTYFEIKQSDGSYEKVNTIQGKTIVFDKSTSDSDHVFLFQDSLTLSRCRIENMKAGYVGSTGFKWHSTQIAKNTVIGPDGKVIYPTIAPYSGGRTTYYASPEGKTSAIGNPEKTTQSKTTKPTTTAKTTKAPTTSSRATTGRTSARKEQSAARTTRSTTAVPRTGSEVHATKGQTNKNRKTTVKTTQADMQAGATGSVSATPTKPKTVAPEGKTEEISNQGSGRDSFTELPTEEYTTTNYRREYNTSVPKATGFSRVASPEKESSKKNGGFLKSISGKKNFKTFLVLFGSAVAILIVGTIIIFKKYTPAEAADNGAAEKKELQVSAPPVKNRPAGNIKRIEMSPINVPEPETQTNASEEKSADVEDTQVPDTSKTESEISVIEKSQAENSEQNDVGSDENDSVTEAEEHEETAVTGEQEIPAKNTEKEPDKNGGDENSKEFEEKTEEKKPESKPEPEPEESFYEEGEANSEDEDELPPASEPESEPEPGKTEASDENTAKQNKTVKQTHKKDKQKSAKNNWKTKRALKKLQKESIKKLGIFFNFKER